MVPIEKLKSRKQKHRQRMICFILIAVLVVSVIVVPSVLLFAEEQHISDYFFVQLYNTEDQIVSKYKVALTGRFSGLSSSIDYVEIMHESGDECETSYSIDGNKVVVTVAHPIEGYVEKTLVLNANGTFSGY